MVEAGKKAVIVRGPPLGCDTMGRRPVRQAEWIRGTGSINMMIHDAHCPRPP
jgi:hypothetical protein